MSTVSLRPALRSSSISSLGFSSSSTPSTSAARTTYICQACRNARLLRRPKRPYTFTQLVALSDGSAFTMRTTSPMPVYRSTRDTRNAPLWNPSSKELLNVEDDEAGRLAGFRARFGTGFDVQRQTPADITADLPSQMEGTTMAKGAPDKESQQSPFFQQAIQTKHSKGGKSSFEDEYYEFEEDDANLLDLISSYGKEVPGPKQPITPTASSSGKKGKK